MPKVSIIIPSYNHAKYIRETINSALNQTFQDFEIIIVDDGSKDESVDIIKSYTDKRIHFYVFEENRGAVVAENYCISKATGEYISLLNSDDMYYPEKLAKQYSFLENHKEIGAVFSFAQAIDDDGKEISPNPSYFEPRDINRTREEFLWTLYHESNQFIHPTIMIRKAVYLDIGLYDDRLCQMPDFLEWVKLCFKYEVYVMPDKLIKFRTRANNMNTSSSERKGVTDRLMFEYQFLLEEYYKNINGYELLEKIFPGILTLPFYKKDPNLIKFYTALAIFHSKVYVDYFEPVRKSFALQKLYEIFSDTKTAHYIKETCGFYYPDLINLSGQSHIYSTREDIQKLITFNALPLSLEWRILQKFNNTIIYRFFSRIYKRMTFLTKEWISFLPSPAAITYHLNPKLPGNEKLLSFYLNDISCLEGNIINKNKFDQRFYGLYSSKNQAISGLIHAENILDFFRRSQSRYLFLTNRVFKINPKLIDQAQFLLENDSLDCIIYSDFADASFDYRYSLTNLIDNFQNNSLYTIFLRKGSFSEKIAELCDKDHQIVFLIQLLGLAIKNKLRIKIFRVSDLKEVKVEANKKHNLKIGRYNIPKEDLIKFNDNKSNRHRIENALINITQTQNFNGKNVFFALPFLLDAGDKHFVRSVVRSVKDRQNNITIITTLDVESTNYLGFGDGEPKYSLITKDIHQLYRLYKDESLWENYINYLIISRNIEYIYVIGCSFIYHLLPKIKERFPKIKIIDEQLNAIGHFRNNRKYSKYIDLTVVENKEMSSLIIDKNKEDPKKIRLIYSGVDTENEFNISKINREDCYQRFQLQQNNFNVIFLGRFSEEKGPDIFIKLAKRFISDDRVKFLMAGDGPMKDDLLKVIKKEHLEKKVRLPGVVKSRDILAVSSLLILPSRNDGRPAVVMEALSMGVPVIASRVGGLPEMIDDNKNGYLVKIADLDVIEEKIKELIADPEKLKIFKQSARESAITKFNENRMFKDYKEVIDF